MAVLLRCPPQYHNTVGTVSKWQCALLEWAFFCVCQSHAPANTTVKSNESELMGPVVMDGGQAVKYSAASDCNRAAAQSRLLETIYEDPKESTDGRAQFTSVRRYKRFIDFTAGPTASKKWKRSQKARKLANVRLVHALEAQAHYPPDRSDDVCSSLRPVRKTRVRAPSSPEDKLISQSNAQTSPRRYCSSAAAGFVCAAGGNDSRSLSWHANSHVAPGGFSLPDTFVVSSADLVVEEAATVELPLEWVSSSRDAGVKEQVRSSVEELLSAVVSNPWDYRLPCPEVKEENWSTLCYSGSDTAQAVSCSSDALGKASMGEPVDERAVHSTGVHVDGGHNERVLPAWATACKDEDVSDTVVELIAVIEATHSICDRVVQESSFYSGQNNRSSVPSSTAQVGTRHFS